MSLQASRRGEPVHRVLYLSHTSLVSGAEFALLELIRALPGGTWARVLCPRGELFDMLRREGIDVAPIRGTAASLRMNPGGLRRAVWDFVGSAVVARREARRSGATVVHANSIRAGLMAILASAAGGPPVVVHVHDVLPDSRVSRIVRSLLLTRAKALIAVSTYARDRFLRDTGSDRPRFPVLYNPIDVDWWDQAAVPRAKARQQLTLPDDVVIGVVAQITPWKGQDVAIRALTEIQRTHPTARLLLVGETKFVNRSTRFDNVTFERELLALVAELGVGDSVSFLGQRTDVPVILSALDVLFVPSWEEPLGRTMLEAMALGTPVIATCVGGPAEVIDDGKTGFLVDPRDPAEWARATEHLLADRALVEQVTASAREMVVRRFDRRRYAEAVVALYDQATAAAPRRRRGARRSPARRADST